MPESPEMPTNYLARRINNGRVVGVCRFYAKDYLAAYSKAHEDIDLLSGQWVEVNPISEEIRV